MTLREALAPTRRRRMLAGAVGVLAIVALAAADRAEALLAGGRRVEGGLLDLQLTYNSGVAFSAGDRLPAWAVLLATGLITGVIAGYAWYSAPRMTMLVRCGVAAVLAGALSNLVDRGADGRVTDYLHTGWFPTFNLADVFISVGAAMVVLATVRRRESPVNSTPHESGTL